MASGTLTKVIKTNVNSAATVGNTGSASGNINGSGNASGTLNVIGGASGAVNGTGYSAGKMNIPVEYIMYNGGETRTAVVTIDNSTKKIYADVKEDELVLNCGEVVDETTHNTLIQFKRGTRVSLEFFLKGEDCPKAGEVIYELDTNRLKVGDGVTDYRALPYISSVGSGLDVIVVDELPEVGARNTIYLVKDASSNYYNEYIWDSTKSEWTKIGTTEIVLSNYYTKSEIDAVINEGQQIEELSILDNLSSGVKELSIIQKHGNESITHVLPISSGQDRSIDDFGGLLVGEDLNYTSVNPKLSIISDVDKMSVYVNNNGAPSTATLSNLGFNRIRHIEDNDDDWDEKDITDNSVGNEDIIIVVHSYKK